MKIIIVEPERSPAAGHVADAEILFTEGPLAGAKLQGFGIWERRGAPGLNVTMPARSYTVNGERRSFALLRPSTGPDNLDAIKRTILDAYDAYRRGQYQTVVGADSVADVVDVAPVATPAPAAPVVAPIAPASTFYRQTAPAPVVAPVAPADTFTVEGPAGYRARTVASSPAPAAVAIDW